VISDCPDDPLKLSFVQQTIASYLFPRWQHFRTSGINDNKAPSIRNFNRPVWLWPFCPENWGFSYMHEGEYLFQILSSLYRFPFWSYRQTDIYRLNGRKTTFLSEPQIFHFPLTFFFLFHYKFQRCRVFFRFHRYVIKLNYIHIIVTLSHHLDACMNI